MRADPSDLNAGLQPAPRAAIGNGGAPELRLGAWEGPLYLLIELARARRVDLARLSIHDLVEQFGALLAAAVDRRRVPLNTAGDWPVMPAHLALLRSRLLLPADGAADGAADAGARHEAEALRRRLADRERDRRLADWLERRHQFGRDVFARGAAEDLGGGSRAVPDADTAALFRACLAVFEKGTGHGAYRPEPLLLWRVPDTLARLRRLLPAAPREGAVLESFLPEVEDLDSDLQPGRDGQHAPGRVGAGARGRRGAHAGRAVRHGPHRAQAAVARTGGRAATRTGARVRRCGGQAGRRPDQEARAARAAEPRSNRVRIGPRPFMDGMRRPRCSSVARGRSNRSGVLDRDCRAPYPHLACGMRQGDLGWPSST